jgi:hypothetical protein
MYTLVAACLSYSKLTWIISSALTLSPATASSSPGPTRTGRTYTARLVSSSLLRPLKGPTPARKPNSSSRAATCSRQQTPATAVVQQGT